MERLNKIVPDTLDSLGLGKKYRDYSVVLYWRSIVGDDIADHSTPVRVGRGILILHASNSTWMHHLFLLKQDIIGKINTYMGDNSIKDIRLQAGRVLKKQDSLIAAESESLFVRLKVIKLTNDEVTAAKQLTNQIAQPDLRRKILNLLYKNNAYTKLKQQEGWQPCRNCGVLCPPDSDFCMACSVIEKAQVTAHIIAYLKQAPWHKYQDCTDQINCSLTDYIQAKQILMNRLVEAVRKGQTDSTTQSTLAMLATGLSPLQLTDKMVKQQVEKFGRKKDVSASRG